MSAPGRRRNPTITRGKKSERKRNKRRGLQTDNVSPINGLAAISEKAEQERKAKLISNEITDADITLLSEPSNTFNTETNNISNIPTKKEQNLININATNFNSGIELDKTKNDRSRVIKGQKPIIFNTMPKELKEKKQEIRQASRQVDDDIIEKTRKRTEQEKKNAAIAHDKKLLDLKKEKEEAERLAQIELERKLEIEAARLAAMEKEEAERLAQIELERKLEIEAARLAAMEKEEAERLAQIELERKLEIEAARLAAMEKEEAELERIASEHEAERLRLEQEESDRVARVEEARLAQIELDRKLQIEKSMRRKKERFWGKLFNKLTTVFAKKEKIQPKSQQQTEDLKTTILEKNEVLIEEKKVEIVIDDEEEIVIDDIEEEVLIEEKKVEIVIDDIEEEPLILWGEETEIEIEDEIDLVIDEVDDEEEIVIDDIEEEPLILWGEETEIEIEDEIDLVIDEVDDEEEIVIDDIEEKVLIEEEEAIPIIESGEVILAELRIAMRTEPSPINYMIKMLANKHNLSKLNAKYIIDHVASPISICKMLTDDEFNSFIQSLDKNNSDSSKGEEMWTQVIQIIGPSSLTEDALVDIYNILSNDENQSKISQRVVTIALLLNALPNNFKHWWSMDSVPLKVVKHYAQHYKFISSKKFPQEAMDEATMLICSYAIEKPKSIFSVYNFAKQMSGNIHETKTEKWLKENSKDVRYITETEIKKYPEKRYGTKYVNQNITPDILLETPIQLSVDSQPIHWIDAKNHFVDPALSSDENVQSICNQMNKYVRTYGPGLIVWGRNFSEEWNHATKGNVQHIRI